MEKNKEHKAKSYKRREIEIKALADTFELPIRVKRGSVGYDLTVPEDTLIPAHSRFGVPMRFAINLPISVEGKIEPRSGHSLRGLPGHGERIVKKKLFGLIPIKAKVQGTFKFNADVLVSKIDPNYTDEVHVLIKNDDDEFTIKAGTRIAQLTFYQVGSPFLKIVDELTCKSRGGGLGSSGYGRVSRKRKEDVSTASTAPHVSSEEDIYTADQLETMENESSPIETEVEE